MSWVNWFQVVAALAITSTAAWTDYRTGLIPNRLTLSGVALGLAAALAGGGANGLLLAAAGSLAALLVPLLLFRARAMGGGDVKLFAALGALLGAGAAIEVEALAFLFGAAQGAALWMRRGVLIGGLSAVVGLAVPPLGRRLSSNPNVQAAKETTIRFGPAVMLATAVAIAARAVW